MLSGANILKKIELSDVNSDALHQLGAICLRYENITLR